MTPEELLRSAQADLRFVSGNIHKLDRERWVVGQWLVAQHRSNVDVTDGSDPPDLVVGGVGIEVVEAMEPGRKRGDEYKAKVDEAKSGQTSGRALPPRRTVVAHAHEWILRQVTKKAEKYGDAARSWTLLVYANFTWGDAVRWDILKTALAELDPPFATVDVLYALATGPVARRPFGRDDGAEWGAP